MSDLDLDELRAELDDFASSRRRRAGARRARSASSPDSRRFSALSRQHGHAPQHGEDRDIFERLYAVRLDRLRALEECRRFSRRSTIRGCLPERDSHCRSRRRVDGRRRTACRTWRARPARPTSPNFAMSAPAPTSARPRKSPTARSARTSSSFKPLFEQVQKEIDSGIRQTRPFETEGRNHGRAVGSSSAARKPMSPRWARCFPNAQGRTDARLRVIFDNGTESNLLMRSLQRALHKDEAGRRITDPTAGPLFSDESAMTIWPAARSMSCGASPTIRSSRQTATFFTRSA